LGTGKFIKKIRVDLSLVWVDYYFLPGPLYPLTI